MNEYKFTQVDFNAPSVPFIIEDMIKFLLVGKNYYKPFFRSISFNGNEKILDFGCGGGTGAKSIARLLKEGGSLTCIDTSEYWTDKARKRLKNFLNTKILCGDIRDADVPGNFYDMIFIMHVIHDIPPGDRRETIGALADKLNNLGRLYVIEPVRLSHGIAPEELESLMNNSGMKKMNSRLTKKEFYGEFQIKR